MPDDGSGVYNLPSNYLAITGDVITAAQHNDPLVDAAAAINARLNINGSKPMTGALPMGSNRITGLADAIAATDGVNRQFGDGRYAIRTNNLSDLSNAVAARANLGLAWELISTTTVSSATATIDFTDLSAYRRLRMSGYVIPATDNVSIFLRTSTNNGSTYDDAGTAYSHAAVRAGISSASAFGLGSNVTGGASGIQISGTTAVGGASANEGITFALEIHEFNTTLFAKVNGSFFAIVEDGSLLTGAFGGTRLENVARNALRILASSGNISRAFVTLEGIRT